MIKWMTLLGAILFFSPWEMMAQENKLKVLRGNKLYEGQAYVEAEGEYRTALEKDPSLFEGNFNLGDALYRQEKYEDAITHFQALAEQAPTKEAKAGVYHNLGNAYLQGGKLEEAVDAYKNGLRNNPVDDDTRYNLAVAQKLLQQKQEQEKEQEKDQDKENEDEQDKQDQKDKEENKDEQDKQEKDKNQEQDEEKKEQEQEQKDEKPGDEGKEGDQEETKPQQLSKQDARNILDQLNRDDQRLQKEIQKKKAKNSVNTQSGKDW